MKSHYAKIPAVHSLLEITKNLQQKIDHVYLKRIIENIIGEIKINPAKWKLEKIKRETLAIKIVEYINKEVDVLLSPTLRRVINATGVILHTGLGRAPLGSGLIQSLSEISGYTNLEINLATGKRGERLDHVTPLLKLLTGADDGVVVNNNAAAVMLMLNTIAKRKEVIVSRGELVEIGGSFRLPEVMKTSGAKMVEVGSTNKTHLADYENVISQKTAAILMVHPSNYEIIGFTAKPEMADLIKLAHQNNIPVIYDLGSGALIDMQQFGFDYEPVVYDIISAGVDLVSFSGDKLLGGPQSGIIVGKNELIKKIRKNHLLRALRCDKITLSLLAQTLQKYLQPGSIAQNNISMGLFSRSPKDLKSLAKKIVDSLPAEKIQAVEIVDAEGRIGSGAYPVFPIKSIALKLNSKNSSAEQLARIFRAYQPPVLGYIENDSFFINLLAITEGDTDLIVESIKKIL